MAASASTAAAREKAGRIEPEIVRALRPEQIVTRVQVSPAGSAAGDHGSDVLPVQLTIDQCEVHLTPASVVVHW